MVQLNSYIRIADNSGIKLVFTLSFKKIYLKKNSVYNIYTVVIKKIAPNIKFVIKKLISYILIVTSKKKINTKRGWVTQFDHTYGIILDLKNLNPLGTKITRPVSVELYKLKKYKITSLIKGYY